MTSLLQLRQVAKLPLTEVVTRTRQNHAFEHATINLLAQRFAGAQVMGFSGPLGFTLLSTLTAEQIIPTVREALVALKAGQSELAIHENCGTNLVMTGLLTTFATILGLGRYVFPGDRKRDVWGFLERLPEVVLLNVVALVIAAPVARSVQANVTTDPDLQDIEIASIFTDSRGGRRRIRVYTRKANAKNPGSRAI
ncbi:MAG: DUF6391 domain-containing protein [Anaerolineae bacterium]